MSENTDHDEEKQADKAEGVQEQHEHKVIHIPSVVHLPTSSPSNPHPAHVVTEKAATGMARGVLHGILNSLDEAFFLTIGGLFGSYLASRGGKENKEKVEAVQKAQQLYREGKYEEAKGMIFKADVFGIGYAGEAGIFAALMWMGQALIDAEQEKLIPPFLKALSSTDDDTLDRFVRVMEQIESVEERGKILFKMARLPGNMNERINEALRISRIKLDPDKNAANVFAAELEQIVTAVVEHSNRKTDQFVDEICAHRRMRVKRRKAAVSRRRSWFSF